MQSVAIVSKPQRAELGRVLPELCAWLTERGFHPILDRISAEYCPGLSGVSREDLASFHPVLALVLGGDGTLLSAARAFARCDVPLLSVNLGALGFLSEVRLSELCATLACWIAGQCVVESRAMLHVEVIRDGAIHREFEALNDVVISKGSIARMGEFSVYLFDQLAASFRADGLIVSTPTGSTAYNLSANGPILAPDIDALVITPICPHLLTIRPIVVRGDAQVTARVEGVPDQTLLTVDGQEALEVKLGDEVRCRRSQHSIQLLRQGPPRFFDVLRAKLKWGER
jgi:NAD+ kinase